MLIDFKGAFNNYFERFPFFVLDAGARGGLKTEWACLRPYLSVVAFEPDAVEYRRLIECAAGDREIRYIQTALLDRKATVPLYVTKLAGLSSVYPPNQEFLAHFASPNTHGYEIKETMEVHADTLDNALSVEERRQVDFIKVDAEGSAYPILKGASGILEGGIVTGLRVEAEFNEKYKGQFLFSDTDAFLRRFGFELFDIRMCHWKRKAGLKTAGTQGQPVHADFVYFLSLAKLMNKLEGVREDERSARAVKFVVLASLYGCYDLACEVVEESMRRRYIQKEEAATLRGQLKAAETFLARVPKLRGRGTLLDLFYHAFMLVVGVWMERSGYWRPTVKL